MQGFQTMRKWVKYTIDNSREEGVVFKDKSRTAEEHAKDMDGYHSDVSYDNKESFFKKWYHHQDRSRIKTYSEFVQKYVDKKNKILSLASGRCAGELYLLDQGYNIVCSDLRELNIHRDAKQLFPEFRFLLLNTLNLELRQSYDVITAFSLIYLFDDDELKLFFKNVANSLNRGGALLIDPSGAADNESTLLLDEVFLKYQTCLKKMVLSLLGKPNSLVSKHHGFRRTDEEIIAKAKEAGFELEVVERNDFLMELRRIRILSMIFNRSGLARKIGGTLGRKMPYVRLFLFRLASH
ncbi:MAG: hypothetical protein COV66_03915 [Nitrospinae bacterium CG11_big_fil_rev_8_21_14_0_20_45_15]|nr:MAG: hypothetical protein COV66_03915 [Nitrospinae bacterium CG11_big_fil_rev_8_21_14_0_20_45_15]